MDVMQGCWRWQFVAARLQLPTGRCSECESLSRGAEVTQMGTDALEEGFGARASWGIHHGGEDAAVTVAVVTAIPAGTEGFSPHTRHAAAPTSA